MGSGDQSSVNDFTIDKIPFETELERKVPRFPLFLQALFVLLCVFVLYLLIGIVHSPCKNSEAQMQTAIYDLQNKVATLEKSLMRTNISTENATTGRSAAATTNVTDILKRAKRGAKRRGRAAFCHLEGKAGLNIFSSPIANPMQMPRHKSECILWMEPDGEPPVLCRMNTIQDSGRNGIQYIKIDKSGTYYVYSQLTYRSGFWHHTGHRVELSRGSPRITQTILQVAAPRKEPGVPESDRNPEPDPLESKYTGGIFQLRQGDMLAVYPIQGYDVFVMDGKMSFFGLYLVKGS